MKTFVENLKIELDHISQTMFELLDNSRIKYSRNDNYSGIVVIAPSNYWDTPTESEQLLQIKLKKQYGQWMETFKLFTENSSNSAKREIDKADTLVVNWIEKKYGWDTPSTIKDAKIIFKEKIAIFYDTLNLYSSSGDGELIAVPDTNALIQKPDPKDYKGITGKDKLTIIFLPTVLSELDLLKIRSSSEFLSKVKSVINRLKGYRQQGNLIEGVVVEKSIKLKMVAAEPRFDRTLSWLDKENNDDRIVASALEIQRDNPSSVVCLITSDINLQNKAEMARLAYLDVE